MTYPIQKTDAEWQAHLASRGAEPRAFDVTRRAAPRTRKQVHSAGDRRIRAGAFMAPD